MPKKNSLSAITPASVLDFLPGQLLISNPRNPRDDLYQAVILVVQDSLLEFPNSSDVDAEVIGVRINDPLEDITVGSIAAALGIAMAEPEPVWFGGRRLQNRIHVVHTLDWSSSSTLMLNSEIGVTSDVSVLMAISDPRTRPSNFRACSGHVRWPRSQLINEIRGDHLHTTPNSADTACDGGNDSSSSSSSSSDSVVINLHHYELVSATPELMFELQGPEQWRRCLSTAAQQQASRWMS